MADVLEVAIPARACAPWRARRAVSAWLRRLCGAPALCQSGEDLVYAVSEAVANCVDHAYRDDVPGAVTVVGRTIPLAGDGCAHEGCAGPFRIELVVGDTGRWRDPPCDPGDRGRGMQMMEQFVDALDVTRARTGTTVTVRRSLDCPGRG